MFNGGGPPSLTVSHRAKVKFRGDHGISFEGTRVSHSVLQAWRTCLKFLEYHVNIKFQVLQYSVFVVRTEQQKLWLKCI